MNKIKTVLFGAAIASSLAGYAADTFGTIQPLPLNVNSKEDAFFVDGTWGEYKNNELDFSSTKGLEKGGTIVDYVFNDIPGKLSFNLTTPSTCSKGWPHSHKVYFYIYEDSQTSSDSYGNKLREYKVGTTATEEIILPKTTKRIRFYYKKDNPTLSGCNYTYDIKFDVTKSINAVDKQITCNGLLGEIKDTITVNYSYPVGDLILENGGNSDLKLRKLSDEGEANKEGTLLVEVSYEPASAAKFTGEIIIRDSQYADNFDKVEVTAEATEELKPETPASIVVSNITYQSAEISWGNVNGAVSYEINVYNQNKELLSTYPCDKASFKLTNLNRGGIYYLGLVAIDEKENKSFESELMQFQTLNLDFGQQLKNAGFEEWETLSKYGKEPLNWNSFGTLKEAFSFASMAKAEQVSQSTEKRPESNGNYSAKIYSRNALLDIWANGNLTTGRINAGSTDATDANSNFNFSDLSNPEHYQVIDVIPDSATLWIKYMPHDASKAEKGANFSFVVHGDDGNNLVKEPCLVDNPLRYAVAETAIATVGEWTRVSIPFKELHTAAENTTKYILVSLSTNGKAGYSTGGEDAVYIDDIVLVYANNVTVEDPATTVFEEGDEITIPFTLSGSFTPSNANFGINQVTLQLSDESGSFENPITISEPLFTDESGVITGIIPSDLPASSAYRVRAFISYGNKGSEANATALTINGTGTPTGIDNQIEQPKLSLYPNPASDNIQIKGASDANYRIYNIAGRTLKTGNGNLMDGIYIADLNQGVYFIEVKRNNQVSVLKFIKE